MTKADLIEGIHQKVGYSKKEAMEIVEFVFEAMKEALLQEGKVKLSGFGNFVVRQKRPRAGRNPQTGQTIEITARKVLGFKASQLLKKALNAPV